MILGIIEHNQGELNKQTLEMLCFARHIGEVEAVIIGESGRSVVQYLGEFGVKIVHLILHKELDDYIPKAWCKSIANLVRSLDPDMILAIGSHRGNELMAHLGAEMHLPMASNCINVAIDGDSCIITRERWGGSLLEKSELKGEQKLITIKPNTVNIEKGELNQIEIIEHNAVVDSEDLLVRIIDRVPLASVKLLLTDARVVVGGGRGVGSSEGIWIT